MAGSVLDSGGGRDELKTQFMTREGTYHLMTLAGYYHHHQPELIKAITNWPSPSPSLPSAMVEPSRTLAGIMVIFCTFSCVFSTLNSS